MTDTDAWAAPLAPGPVRGTVEVPGSKSATNRALVLAALADGPTTISAGLLARDTRLMMAALSTLGASINEIDPLTWHVTPGPPTAGGHVDVGLAGTVMRFVPPIAGLADGPTTFDGDARARERPLGPLLDALGDLGVACTSAPGGHLPVTVHGTGRVTGEEVTLDASASSQFVSALLLVAARFDRGLTVRHIGAPVPSLPHIDMTIAMLAEQGVTVTSEASNPSDATWQVPPGTIRAVDRVIEPDLSNAAPFLAAAVVTGGQVTIPRWPTATTQAGDALRQLLTRVGARVDLDHRGLTITGPDTVHPLDVDLRDVGELTPVVTAICALATGPSTLRGIGHLRGHETDRLAALVDLLTRLGGYAEATDDGLTIRPRPLRGATVPSYEDHRMATAAAVLGLVTPGVRILDIDTTAKTLPDFPRMWAALVESAG